MPNVARCTSGGGGGGGGGGLGTTLHSGCFYMKTNKGLLGGVPSVLL